MMATIMEMNAERKLSFEESLKSMNDNDLLEMKRDLKSQDSDEADMKLGLVLKEMEERKREKETWSRDISMEAKTIALNWKIQSIRASFEEKKNKIDRSTAQWKAEYKLLVEQEAAAIKKQIQEFAHTDVRDFEGSKRSIEETKNAEIARLTGLLEEKPSITNAIKDRLSPSSLKLQNVEKHIQKLKNDRANYPWNMLRYLSSVTTSYFLTPLQRAKGGWQTLSKNWKSDEELWKRYDVIKEILQVNHWDSAWRMSLKQRLRWELEAAQTQFVENARNRARKQVGLAA